MTTFTTNFDAGAARSMMATVSWPLHTVRSACTRFVRARRRSQDVFQMTQLLSRLNERQLSALGLVREQLYHDLEDRYDRSSWLVDDVLSLVKTQTALKAISHDPSVQTSEAAPAAQI